MNFIIIPCYNEAENINKILGKIDELKFKNLVIVIVDDSKKSFLNKIKSQKLKVIYLKRKRKSGRGSAILFGISHILKLKKKINFIVEMDADLSHDPKELIHNIRIFKKRKLDLLISSRYRKKSLIINWPITRKCLSYLSNILSRLLLKIPITDYTNGFRIYSYNAAKFILPRCGKIGDGYIVLSEILTHLYYNNFRIDEVPTIFVNRIRGKSNVTINEIINSFLGLIKIWNIKKKYFKN